MIILPLSGMPRQSAQRHKKRAHIIPTAKETEVGLKKMEPAEGFEPPTL
jgi:hypothetical protein